MNAVSRMNILDHFKQLKPAAGVNIRDQILTITLYRAANLSHLVHDVLDMDGLEYPGLDNSMKICVHELKC